MNDSSRVALPDGTIYIDRSPDSVEISFRFHDCSAHGLAFTAAEALAIADALRAAAESPTAR